MNVCQGLPNQVVQERQKSHFPRSCLWWGWASIPQSTQTFTISEYTWLATQTNTDRAPSTPRTPSCSFLSLIRMEAHPNMQPVQLLSPSSSGPSAASHTGTCTCKQFSPTAGPALWPCQQSPAPPPAHSRSQLTHPLLSPASSSDLTVSSPFPAT